MSSAPSRPSPEVLRALKISVVEGSLHAVMLGVAESYLGAFAVELGHGAENLALLATLPLFCGALSQIFSGSLSRKLGRKRLAVVGAALQALSLGGLMLIAVRAETGFLPLLLMKMAFWISGSIMAPAWNSWIAALTQGISRQRYFGRRSAITHICVLSTFCAAGATLHHNAPHTLPTFAALFSVGMLARCLSSLGLALQADAPDDSSNEAASAVQRTLAAFREGRFRVAVYLGCMMFGGSIAIPFFTPYMLNELKLSYGTFTLLSAISILTKAAVFPLLHHVAKRVGLGRVLVAAGVGIALVPVLWSTSTRFEVLVIVHVVSGVAWATLEFASFQLLMNDIRAPLRTEFFSLTNTFSGLLQVLGAVSGGWLLRHGTGFIEVFLLSALLRALPLLLLLAALPRLRLPRRLLTLPMRLLTVRPSAGAAQRPIELAASDTEGPNTERTEPSERTER